MPRLSPIGWFCLILLVVATPVFGYNVLAYHAESSMWTRLYEGHGCDGQPYIDYDRSDPSGRKMKTFYPTAADAKACRDGVARRRAFLRQNLTIVLSAYGVFSILLLAGIWFGYRRANR